MCCVVLGCPLYSLRLPILLFFPTLEHRSSGVVMTLMSHSVLHWVLLCLLIQSYFHPYWPITLAHTVISPHLMFDECLERNRNTGISARLISKLVDHFLLSSSSYTLYANIYLLHPFISKFFSFRTLVTLYSCYSFKILIP